MKMRFRVSTLVAVAALGFSSLEAYAQGVDITVVQWNVRDNSCCGGLGEEPDEIGAIVAQNADVIFLQEVDRVDHLDAIVAALGTGWSHKFVNRDNTPDRDGTSFLAILSRLPFSEPEQTTPLNTAGEVICNVSVADPRAAIGVKILINDQPVAVFSTRNTFRPLGLSDDCVAKEQTRRFKVWADDTFRDVTHLYGGDFNMYPNGIAYPVMTADSKDAWEEALNKVPSTATAADDPTPDFFTPTKNNRLDYLFHKNAGTVLSVQSAHITGLHASGASPDGLASDHRMMTAMFTVGSADNTTTIDILPTDDVFIRGGPYANDNFNDPVSFPYIATRASSTDEFRRRVLLKFDTTTIPAGATIVSAKLIVTLKFTNSESRTISAFDVTESGWVESTVTWNNRTPTSPWITPGATLGSVRATATIGTTVGTQYTFDVPTWVQTVVNGQQPGGSRFTRLALVDIATTGTNQTYKEFHSEESSVERDMKPRLVVIYR